MRDRRVTSSKAGKHSKEFGKERAYSAITKEEPEIKNPLDFPMINVENVRPFLEVSERILAVKGLLSGCYLTNTFPQ